MRKNVLLMIVSLLMMACNNDDTQVSPYNPYKERVDIPLTTAELSMVNQNNQFAFNLFRNVAANTDHVNFTISPFSIQILLSMISNGSHGETASQINNMLGYADFAVQDINNYNKKMSHDLLEVDPSTQLTMANSIWIDKDYSLKPSFIDVNKVNYNAEVSSLDFADNNAASIINQWCASQTNNLIKEPLKSVDSQTQLMLMNAIYFKGEWSEKFKKSNTERAIFYAVDGSKNTVNMMNDYATVLSYVTDHFKMFEKNYGNEAFSMVVIVPNDKDAMSEVVNDVLTPTYWNNIMDKMQDGKIDIGLPKFRLNFSDSMVDYLKKMGMVNAFDTSADFSGITDGGLVLNLLQQDLHIEVNEEGTEAAVISMGGNIGSAGNKQIIADRPFIFLIKEKSTGIILFMGRINKL